MSLKLYTYLRPIKGAIFTVLTLVEVVLLDASERLIYELCWCQSALHVWLCADFGEVKLY